MAARWQHEPTTAAADAGRDERGHTFEVALARVRAIVRDSGAAHARRDPEHPAIEAVGDDLARPPRILLTDLLAAGLTDCLNRLRPRFSVVRSRLSNAGESPANKPLCRREVRAAELRKFRLFGSGSGDDGRPVSQ
jgi:hypothetical protein